MQRLRQFKICHVMRLVLATMGIIIGINWAPVTVLTTGQVSDETTTHTTGNQPQATIQKANTASIRAANLIGLRRRCNGH